jgi:GR25 family glycosyltransferase involved in LPS biosynthesis
MKTFIIAIKNHKESEELANRSVLIANELGYEASIFYSLTNGLDMQGSESLDFLNSENVYPILRPRDMHYAMYKHWTNIAGVRGSFSSHYRLWLKCIELQEPIVILEHDAILVKPWQKQEWEDVLHLDWEGSLKRRQFRGSKDKHLPVVENSIFRMGFMPEETQGTISMNCCYAYAITPDACRKLVEESRYHGWFAVDRFIREPLVQIQTVHPKIAEEVPEALILYTTST